MKITINGEAHEVAGPMRERWENFGYRLCLRGDWVSDLWSRVWFRFYCPYPLRSPHTATACIGRGECGCENELTT